MDKYTKLEKLGEGAHGVVTKARVRSVESIRTIRREERQAAKERAAAKRRDTQQGTATGASASQTPKKRKFEEDEDEEDDMKMTFDDEEDEDDDIEILDPIELPAPADTWVTILNEECIWIFVERNEKLATSPSLYSCQFRSRLLFLSSFYPCLLVLSIVAIKKIRLRSASEGLSMEAIRSVAWLWTMGEGRKRATGDEILMFTYSKTIIVLRLRFM